MKLTKEIAALEEAHELTIKAETAQHPAVISFIMVVITYWPLIRKSLTIVKIFTGKKADEKIDKILAAGEEVSEFL